jgi:hypothetical protein
LGNLQECIATTWGCQRNEKTRRIREDKFEIFKNEKLIEESRLNSCKFWKMEVTCIDLSFHSKFLCSLPASQRTHSKMYYLRKSIWKLPSLLFPLAHSIPAGGGFTSTKWTLSLIFWQPFSSVISNASFKLWLQPGIIPRFSAIQFIYQAFVYDMHTDIYAYPYICVCFNWGPRMY